MDSFSGFWTTNSATHSRGFAQLLPQSSVLSLSFTDGGIYSPDIRPTCTSWPTSTTGRRAWPRRTSHSPGTGSALPSCQWLKRLNKQTAIVNYPLCHSSWLVLHTREVTIDKCSKHLKLIFQKKIGIADLNCDNYTSTNLLKFICRTNGITPKLLGLHFMTSRMCFFHIQDHFAKISLAFNTGPYFYVFICD